MILLTLPQQLIAQSFLGGSGQELARFYLLAAKRSVVTSERAVKGYGAQRFAIGEKDKLIYPEGTFLRITHNSPILNLGPDPKGPPTQRQFPNVDCLSVTFMPLAIAGLTTLDSEAQYRELATNTSTLQLTRASPFTKALIGKGSDSIGNLVNDGLTKPITFPTLLGKIWFSCSMVQVSEIDFLNAVAQVADCKLVDKADVYEFVPNIEQVRARLL
ncbi:MAG: hypothetical protein WCG75_10620, partial [Armatimonadota bacterium]